MAAYFNWCRPTLGRIAVAVAAAGGGGGGGAVSCSKEASCGTQYGWWSKSHIDRYLCQSCRIFLPYVCGFTCAWITLSARNSSTWIFPRFRYFERPRHAPRSPAGTHTCAPQPRAREKTRGWRRKAGRRAKKCLSYLNIYTRFPFGMCVTLNPGGDAGR